MKKLMTSPEQIIKNPNYEEWLWPYLVTLPFSCTLVVYVMIKKKIYKLLGLPGPHTNVFLFDGLGIWCRKVKEGATTWKSMEIVYNHPFPVKKTIGGFLDEFFWHSLNSQALRNRFKLVKQEVRKATGEFSDQGEIRVISLACGSAQAMIEIISEFKASGKVVKAILVDIDQGALDRAKYFAEKHGVLDQIRIIKDDASTVVDLSREFKPHIVEMLGLLDYIDQNKSIMIAKKIRESLGPSGIFITCNIAPNLEQYFLKWVINWPMVYRRPNDLAEIATGAGFDSHQLVYEPIKIHGILIARK
jgi:hypothetical protein